MIESILQPGHDDQLIFLGDFINKGPDSKKVIDYIMELQISGIRIQAVMGNHDKLLLDLMDNLITISQFEEKGGDWTMKSFDATTCRDIPQKYFKFIEGLSQYLIIGNLVIVHAGINFKSGDPWRDYESMRTIRNYRVSENRKGYRRIIHGHQASTLSEILSRVLDEEANTINLDNGCVYTEREGMGNLFVLNLKDMSFHILPCMD
jgi:serine/threonine protein phosphatase 1